MSLYHPFPTGINAQQPNIGGKTLRVYSVVNDNGVWKQGETLTTFTMIDWLGNFECLSYAKSLFPGIPVICAILNKIQ